MPPCLESVAASKGTVWVKGGEGQGGQCEGGGGRRARGQNGLRENRSGTLKKSCKELACYL